jgi:hypothetical protein
MIPLTNNSPVLRRSTTSAVQVAPQRVCVQWSFAKWDTRSGLRTNQANNVHHNTVCGPCQTACWGSRGSKSPANPSTKQRTFCCNLALRIRNMVNLPHKRPNLEKLDNWLYSTVHVVFDSEKQLNQPLCWLKRHDVKSLRDAHCSCALLTTVPTRHGKNLALQTQDIYLAACNVLRGWHSYEPI